MARPAESNPEPFLIDTNETVPTQKSLGKLSIDTQLLIANEARCREKQAGVAIDSQETYRPEDAIDATFGQQESYHFAASIIEVGILDRHARTIKDLLGKINSLPDYRVSVDLPKERKLFCYGHNQFMPSLTLRGIFDATRGVTEFDLHRTQVRPWLCREKSRKTTQLPQYPAISAFTKAFRQYEKAKSSESKKIIKPPLAVASFAQIVNIGVASLALEARLPQLLHTQSAEIELPDGSTRTINEVTAHPVGNPHFKGQQYTGVTNPMRDLRNWINQVSVTHFMDSGESVMTHDEAQLIADWMNKRKRVALHEKFLRLTA